MSDPRDLVRVRVNKGCLINEGGVQYRSFQEFITTRRRAGDLSVHIIATVEPYAPRVAVPPVPVERKKRNTFNRVQADGFNRAG